MKIILIASLTLFLSACSNNVPRTDVSGTLNNWKQHASEYPGNEPDLSDASKRAIVLGKPELAERPYLTAYNSEYGRRQFGVESLYQIFLVYIDPHNSARDIGIAKRYLDQMVSEWPNESQTLKAISKYENASS